MVRRAVLVLLVVGAGTGCGAGATSGAATPSVLASLARTGGFAGRSDQVTVRADGQVVRRSRGTATHRFRLRPRRLGALRELVRAAHLPRHADLGGPSCCDQFTYVVTTPGHRATWTDGAKVPRRILRLEAALAALATPN